MRKFVKVSLISALLVLLAACGSDHANMVVVSPASSNTAGSQDALQMTGDQMKSLKKVAVTLETIPDIEEAVGKVGFNEDETTPVYSPYAGRITELLAKPGDTIMKGAPLLIVDSPEVVDAANDFLAGQAELSKAEAALKQAERTRDRVQKLVAGEAAAPKDLELALTDVESATGGVRVAEAQIDSAKQRLLNFGKTEAEIEQIAEARRTDRATRVLAPIGGLIVARKVGPGQYIRPDNPEPLFTIADTSTMWLLAQVYESQIPLVRIGDRVQVRVLSNQTFPARVDYIASTLDPATRRVTVRCVVQNRGNQLKPEMFASFRFEKAPRRAMLVPQKAVVREDNLAVVWVVESGNRISRRPVELGAEHDGRVEIKSGLAGNETVVADGALFLSSVAKG